MGRREAYELPHSVTSRWPRLIPLILNRSVRSKHRGYLVAIFFASLAFYAIPLFSGNVAIHWDAITYYYPYQKLFSDSLHSGKLPFWTSSIFSGFPVLADLQMGAWYPLNWPFFLAGIRPGSMFGELWLHALVAALGAYLLCYHLIGSRRASLLAALMYGFSGYFAAHSEHIGLFQAVAYLPILLWCFLRAVETPTPSRLAAACLLGGCLCLTGHFQSVLYVICAMWLAAVWRITEEPVKWMRIVAIALLVTVVSPMLAAVQLLPSFQLLTHAYRAELSSKNRTEGMANPRTLATFMVPNAAGTLDPQYHGALDISQSYFYAGVLLIPLALAGLTDRRVRRLAAFLILPVLAYVVGPVSPFYWAMVRLPGFSSVRSPSHAMFVATLGLALLAAAGADVISRRLRKPWLVAVLCGLTFLDLFYWNMLRTPLVYAAGSHDKNYTAVEQWFLGLVKAPLPPLTRVGAPGRWVFFYPAMAPFAWPVETTFGENALLFKRYYDYELAMAGNHRLLNALGVVRYFGDPQWTVYENPGSLPRFHFPPRILPAYDTADVLRQLAELDPAQAAIAEPDARGLPAENAAGTVQVLAAAEDRYALQTTCPADCTLRIAIPYFPGWRAEMDGRKTSVFALDHALMGVRLPAGSHALHFYFRQDYFALGAAISLSLLCAGLYLLLRPGRVR